MPVSEHEETAVKPVTQNSSDYSAGIPIKKRRFPIIRPLSPPPEEQCLLSVESSLKKDQSLQFPVTTSPNLTVAPSSKLSNTNNIPDCEVRRGTSDIKNEKVFTVNGNYAEVKVEEPSLTVQTWYLDRNRNNTNVMLDSTENVSDRVISRKNELNIPSTQSFVLDRGNNEDMNQKAEMKINSEVCAHLETAESFLSVDKQFAPVMGGENNYNSYQNQESSDSISLNLSLSEERCSSLGKSDDDKLCNKSARLCVNRANWDLNTSMDAWDGGPVTDVTHGQMSIDGSITSSGTLDMKSKTCSTRIVNAGKHAASLIGNVTNSIISSVSPRQKNKYDDSLHLHLRPPSPQSSMNYEPFTSSHSLNWEKFISVGTLPKVPVLTRNLKAAINVRTVKSEPLDKSIRLDPKGANTSNLQLLNSRVKQELLERCSLEVHKPTTCASQLVGTRSIKAEPSFEANKGTVKLLKESALQLNRLGLQNTDGHSCVITQSVASEIACSAEKSFCGTELTVRDHSDHYEQYTQSSGAQHDVSSENREVATDTDATLLGVDGKEDVTAALGYGFDHPESCKLDGGNNSILCSSKNGEGSVSDEERINLSGDMLEEDSYCSDFELDCNRDVEATSLDTEQDGGDDDYEDGEVREPPESTWIQESMPEKGEVDQIDNGNINVKKIEPVVPFSDADSNTAYMMEQSNRTEDTAETINQDGKETSDAVCMDESDVVSNKNVCLPETLAIEKPSSGTVLREFLKATSLDYLGSKDLQKYQETGVQYEQNTNECEGSVMTSVQVTEANFDKTELVQNEDVSLPKGLPDGDNALKDNSGGSHHSRLIHLPRSSSCCSPGKTRSISGRFFPSSVGRDGLPDDDKKQYPGRDDIYFDNNPKFARERYQDRSPRNSRKNFLRGRGRIGSRLDNLCGDRRPDRDIASEFSEFYNGPAEFHVHRNKYASDVPNADLEYSSYNNGQDVGFAGADRSGRRPHGGRHDIHMDRRISRNISPGRCISENSSEFAGLRRNGKFSRGFRGDRINPMFSHCQQSYEGEDGRFGYGNRVFSSVHRKERPGIRSKSPISSSPRTPGTWSAPRRRLPEEFEGHSNLTQRKSPPFYRMDKTRSPVRPCFLGEVALRWNDTRDTESGRDRSHPRSVIPSRSPSRRIAIRNRRYNVIDTQERPDGDEYFGVSMHLGRLHELSGEGIADDHRRFAEKRGPIRTYRPPYNCADGGNFHLNPEDGPRPFRFYPEDDREFQERGNSRIREFDQRFKNRPGNVPRRIRSIGEQDENYRRGGLNWNDDGFDDISRFKRKRF